MTDVLARQRELLADFLQPHWASATPIGDTPPAVSLDGGSKSDSERESSEGASWSASKAMSTIRTPKPPSLRLGVHPGSHRPASRRSPGRSSRAPTAPSAAVSAPWSRRGPWSTPPAASPSAKLALVQLPRLHHLAVLLRHLGVRSGELERGARWRNGRRRRRDRPLPGMEGQARIPLHRLRLDHQGRGAVEQLSGCSPTVCGNVAHIETKTSSHRILVGLGFDLGQILPSLDEGASRVAARTTARFARAVPVKEVDC
jgi:hypothetical protein